MDSWQGVFEAVRGKGAVSEEYHVRIWNYGVSYVEHHQADSPLDAQNKARERWQRQFGDAAGFNFTSRRESGCECGSDECS